MEFRDSLFNDDLDQPQSLKAYEDDDFQNIITYLGEDFLNKYIVSSKHLISLISLLLGKWNFSIEF